MLGYITKQPLFPLGSILIEPEIQLLGIETPRLLHRHQSGDFGCVDAYDIEQNIEAIESGEGILSQYHVMAREKEILICIMTEVDRSFTVVFVPDKMKLDLPNLPEGGSQLGSETS